MRYLNICIVCQEKASVPALHDIGAYEELLPKKNKSKKCFSLVYSISSCHCSWGELAANSGASSWSHSSQFTQVQRSTLSSAGPAVCTLIVSHYCMGVLPVPTARDRAEARCRRCCSLQASCPACRLRLSGDIASSLGLFTGSWYAGREFM